MSEQAKQVARTPSRSATAAPTKSKQRPLPVAALSNQLQLMRTPADRVQAQLDVGQPDDVYEREAERIADAVVGRRAITPATPDLSAVRRAPAAPDEKKKKEAPAPARPAATPAPKPAPPKAAPPPPPPTRVESAKPAEPKPAEPRAAEAKKGPPVETRPPDKKKAEAPPVTSQPDTKEESSRKKDEEQSVAAKAMPGTVPSVTPAVAAGIRSQEGAGQPLGSGERSFYEGRMNRDLSNVRVHDDAPAAASARELSAQAFTYGQDIFFGAGRHQPHTAEGSRLLAHELAHTMQQRPSGVARRIQRQAGGQPPGGSGTGGAGGGGAATTAPAAGGADATQLSEDDGRLDVSKADDPKVVFSSIELPSFKYEGHRKLLYDSHPPIRQHKNYTRGNPQQRDFWKTNVDTKTIKSKLAQMHDSATSGGASTGYLFAGPKTSPTPNFFIGDADAVATALTTPTWDTGGTYHRFDVDHIRELQLADWPDQPWANTLENMELLESSANQSSGSTIAKEINRKASAFTDKAAGDKRVPHGAANLREKYPLEFKKATAGAAMKPPPFWQRSQIEAGDQLDQVRVAHQSELGMPGELKIFPSPSGGRAKTFTWPPNDVTSAERNWLGIFKVTSKSFKAGPESVTDANFGTLTFNMDPNSKVWEQFPSDLKYDVQRLSSAPFAGYVEKGSLLAMLRSQRVKIKQASPIEVTEVDILPDVGLYVAGKIMPDVPVLKGGIDFELKGTELSATKEFTLGEVDVPKPFSIDNVSLVITLMTAAPYVQAQGQIDFGIERVGKGFVGAQVGATEGIEFDGEFNFDTKLFQPARLHVGYHGGNWEGSGDLGIPAGKVPGIKRADIHAGYTQGVLTAQGAADLTIPGVQQGAMSLTYSEAQGLAIGGSFTLASNIPGIRGGSVEAKVQERPGGEGYAVHATGTAQPAIPGVDAQLTVTYDDGAFTIGGQAAYSRGMMSGSIAVGATNRPVDAAGNPVPDAEPTEKLTAFGSGSVTVRLTPWLQGTVGIRLLGNGEIELAGAIALPSELRIFEEKSYTKNIFTINIDIPIVGLSVAGVRVGIFATIGGGLDFSAGVGPGVLRDVGVSITYNPSHEDQTHVVGAAHLHIPAHAGLRLFVHGGIGAGIPLVSATAGLEVGGQLGLEAAADAGVQIDWMPNRGLVLDASASVSVEPKFKFDVTGYVTVDAGAFGFTYNLYEKKWQLAAVEYGSGLRLGMTLPIHYQEGQPFDVSWNDVQFEIPQVNATDVLKGLIAQIA